MSDPVPVVAPALEQRGVLLCASLFYFRLPEEEWPARLQQVARSGYTCIDVYLPWNFHEVAPRSWDFAGQRDVARFLDLAGEAGLHVIARPGPYICSEWDGGALPAWLTLDPALRLRDNNPAFLAEVERWFDRALPILAERQAGNGGPVIMVQLENELDFYDCADRVGYVTVLRDLAHRHGLEVPLLACAGQGDISAAGASVEGITPACNFYPDDSSPDIESEIRHYAHLVAERGAPLLVTETNRMHVTLRRMLASGARLLAPYLQASGVNHGFTPSVGNWGTPGSLMAHDYDFGGYVDAAGAERAEFAEAQLLAAVVRTWQDRWATARPVEYAGVVADVATAASPSALEFRDGGRLLAVPNLEERDGTATVPTAAGPLVVPLPAHTCPLLPLDMPLAPWGVRGVLVAATADLVGVQPAAPGDELLLDLAADGAAAVLVQLDGQVARLDLSGPGDEAAATSAAGTVRVRAVATGRSCRTADRRPTTEGVAPDVPVTAAPATDLLTAHGERHREPPPLEAAGVYRGRGRYATTTDLAGVSHLVLAGAGDIVDVQVGGQTVRTLAPFGALSLIDIPSSQANESRTPAEICVDVEIWGHANFDDHRLPTLRLGSTRGVGRVWALAGRRQIGAGWQVLASGGWPERPEPLRSLGGWSSTRLGAPVTYARRAAAHAGGDTALLLTGLTAPVQVRVGDDTPVVVVPDDPWLLLPRAEDDIRIAVTIPHHPSAPRLDPVLLDLRPLTDWTLATATDAELTAAASRRRPSDAPADLPLRVGPGGEQWLDVRLPPSPTGYRLRPQGRQVRVTAWFDGWPLGRVWLADPARPAFTGGDPGLLWIPPGRTTRGGRLTFLVRGTEGAQTPELSAIGASSG